MSAPHGTVARYTGRDRCRCSRCRAAASRNAKLRAYNAGRGMPATVDAGPVREHLDRLRAVGIGRRTVSARTQVSLSALYCITAGRSKRVRRSVAVAILGVEVDPNARGAGALAPLTASTRRLQALAVLGWSLPELSVRSALDRDLLSRIRLGKGDGVTRPTEIAIETLFADLWATEPPRGSKAERASYGRTRTLATRYGWAPPMAWDDETIGDPAARPAHQLAGLSTVEVVAAQPDAPDAVLADLAGVRPSTVANVRRRLAAERVAS